MNVLILVVAVLILDTVDFAMRKYLVWLTDEPSIPANCGHGFQSKK